MFDRNFLDEVSLRDCRTWEFSPSSARPSREEFERFPAHLTTALNSAANLRLRLILEWETGGSPRVRLRSPSPHADEWFRSSLTRVYLQGQWVASTESLWERPFLGGRLGIRAVAVPSSDPTRLLVGCCAESVMAVLHTLPRGVRITWEFLPAPRREESGWSWLVQGSLQTPGAGFAPARRPFELLRQRGEIPSPRMDAPWVVRVRIDPLSMRRLATLRDAQAMIISALRSWNGAFRFVACRPPFRLAPPPILLSEAEMLTLWPSLETVLPRREGPAVRNCASVSFGTTVLGDRAKLILDPRQGRHLAILGETGMGKSTALVDLALAARELGGVILVDPIGDTGQRLMSALPASERPHAIWISPRFSPLSINALGNVGPDDDGSWSRDRALSELVTALRRVRASRYGDVPFWGPRIEEMTHEALRAAAGCMGGTLIDAQHFLEDEPPGAGAAPEGARVAVQNVRKRARERPEEVDGARRLLAELNRVTMLRELLSSPIPDWKLADALTPGRMVIISGDAPFVGETTARYLTSIYLALLWSALLAHPTREKRFLLLDEVQWFAQESLTEALRVGRRLNLHLWVATQSLDSLPETVREALLTNASDLLVFRGSPRDAIELGRWTHRVSPEIVLSLPKGQAIWLHEKGRQVQWVRLDLKFPRETALESNPTNNNAATKSCEMPSDPLARPPSHDVKIISDPRRLVLAVIWADLDANPNLVRIHLPLSRLRSALGPDQTALREVGGILGRNGLLEATGRDDGGSFWVLRRAGMEKLLDPPLTGAEMAFSRALWRRVCRIPAPPGPQQSY